MESKIEFKPFTSSDFDKLKSWITSEEDLVQFAGSIFTYPLSDSQLTNYINHPDLHPCKVILSETQEVVGHCEFNYQNGGYRLSRVLVGETHLRGQKIGEHMIREMAKVFFKDGQVTEVDLNVFEFNKAAIRCYQKIGFQINPKISTHVLVNGKTWHCLNMILKRDNLR